MADLEVLSDTEKAQKSAEAKELVKKAKQEVVDIIKENLEKGNLLGSSKWTPPAGGPINALTNKPYTRGNRLKLSLISILNNYDDPRWLTLTQAKELGATLKPEAENQGVDLIRVIFTKEIDDIDLETGERRKIEVPLGFASVATFRVYHASQFNGLEAYIKPPTVDIETEVFNIADKLIQTSECPIQHIEQDRAFYHPKKDEIVLPLRSQFIEDVSYLTTLTHEMVHSTGHHSRLDRDLSGSFGSQNYAKEELVAELGATFVAMSLGIQLNGKHFENHSSYIQSWQSLIKHEPNVIDQAAKKAEKASEFIVSRYLELEQENYNGVMIQSFKDLYKDDLLAPHFHDLTLNLDGNQFTGVHAYEELLLLMDRGDDVEHHIQINYGNDFSINTIFNEKDFSNVRFVSDGLANQFNLDPQEIQRFKVIERTLIDHLTSDRQDDRNIRPFSSLKLTFKNDIPDLDIVSNNEYKGKEAYLILDKLTKYQGNNENISFNITYKRLDNLEVNGICNSKINNENYSASDLLKDVLSTYRTHDFEHHFDVSIKLLEDDIRIFNEKLEDKARLDIKAIKTDDIKTNIQEMNIKAYQKDPLDNSNKIYQGSIQGTIDIPISIKLPYTNTKTKTFDFVNSVEFTAKSNGNTNNFSLREDILREKVCENLNKAFSVAKVISEEIREKSRTGQTKPETLLPRNVNKVISEKEYKAITEQVIDNIKSQIKCVDLKSTKNFFVETLERNRDKPINKAEKTQEEIKTKSKSR